MQDALIVQVLDHYFDTEADLCSEIENHLRGQIGIDAETPLLLSALSE
ncbi:MAG: hypothetical protein R3332_05990 [Pseudohongiellaceae bacterium]|nr:hypothetical protein [Pseudohongiellaceae bacterium]